MEHGPGLKMYFLLKMGIFQPAMLVYQRVYIKNYQATGWEATNLNGWQSTQVPQGSFRYPVNVISALHALHLRSLASFWFQWRSALNTLGESWISTLETSWKTWHTFLQLFEPLKWISTQKLEQKTPIFERPPKTREIYTTCWLFCNIFLGGYMKKSI